MYCLKFEDTGGKRPWVAKITGLSSTYGLEREFLAPLRDYNAVFMGARKLTFCFILEDGEVYEVFEPSPCEEWAPKSRRVSMWAVPPNAGTRYYCRLTNKNALEKIPLDEVMAAVRVNREIKKAIRPKKLSERIYEEE
jgi:hypothetical protein